MLLNSQIMFGYTGFFLIEGLVHKPLKFAPYESIL